MDRISRSQRSENMRRIRGEDTRPEMKIRSLLHSLGYRYRLHRNDLPGCPDIVFGPKRKVIFVHGCFWHQHRACRDGHVPKSRHYYWLPKLKHNKDRDRKNQQELRQLGWACLVIWACETSDERALVLRVCSFLN